MSSIPLRKQDVFMAVGKPPPCGPAHPAAPALTETAARAAARAAKIPAGTGYRRIQAPDWLLTVIASAVGLMLFVCVWAVIAKSSGSIPGPAKVWDAAVTIYSDPFYQKNPNDQGIGWNVISSLKRVGIGFGLAALVGIPLGFIVGRFKFLSDAELCIKLFCLVFVVCLNIPYPLCSLTFIITSYGINIRRSSQSFE